MGLGSRGFESKEEARSADEQAVQRYVVQRRDGYVIIKYNEVRWELGLHRLRQRSYQAPAAVCTHTQAIEDQEVADLEDPQVAIPEVIH